MYSGQKTNGEMAYGDSVAQSVDLTSTDDDKVLEKSPGSRATIALCIRCAADLQETVQSCLLPCLHSVCAPCISSLESTDGIRISCPMCLHVNRKSDVVDNKLLRRMYDAVLLTIDEQFCNSCDADSNVVAEHYCLDCGDHLCEACRLAHRRVKVTKDHNVVPKATHARRMGSLDSYGKDVGCPIHVQETLKLYCETCDQLTCRDCQLFGKHVDHQYKLIPDAAAACREQISRLVARLVEKRQYVESATRLIEGRRMDILSKEESVTNMIKSFQLQLMREINKKGQQLLSDLQMTCAAKCHQLTQKRKEVEALSANLSHCLSFAQFAVNSDDDAALLHCQRTVAQRLLAIQGERCAVPNPYHVIDVRFQENATVLQEISQLGLLIVDGLPVKNVFASSNLTSANNHVNGITKIQSSLPSFANGASIHYDSTRSHNTSAQVSNSTLSCSVSAVTDCKSQINSQLAVSLSTSSGQVADSMMPGQVPMVNKLKSMTMQQKISLLKELQQQKLTSSHVQPQQHALDSSADRGAEILDSSMDSVLASQRIPIDSGYQWTSAITVSINNPTYSRSPSECMSVTTIDTRNVSHLRNVSPYSPSASTVVAMNNTSQSNVRPILLGAGGGNVQSYSSEQNLKMERTGSQGEVEEVATINVAPMMGSNPDCINTSDYIKTELPDTNDSDLTDAYGDSISVQDYLLDEVRQSGSHDDNNLSVCDELSSRRVTNSSAVMDNAMVNADASGINFCPDDFVSTRVNKVNRVGIVASADDCEDYWPTVTTQQNIYPDGIGTDDSNNDSTPVTKRRRISVNSNKPLGVDDSEVMQSNEPIEGTGRVLGVAIRLRSGDIPDNHDDDVKVSIRTKLGHLQSVDSGKHEEVKLEPTASRDSEIVSRD